MNYINKKELDNLLKQPDENKVRISELFLKLATGVSQKFKFYCEFDREDAIGEAWITLFTKIPKYDVSRQAAFAYFTSVAFNAFRQSFRTRNQLQSLHSVGLPNEVVAFSRQVTKSPVKVWTRREKACRVERQPLSENNIKQIKNLGKLGYESEVISRVLKLPIYEVSRLINKVSKQSK